LGIFYAVLSGIMVLIQGPVLRKALKKFSEEKLVIIGSMILGTNFILFASNNIVSVGGAVILFAVGKYVALFHVHIVKTRARQE
jgi:MFS transporter, DHA1 family, tetracycline resistance protein